VGKINSLNIWFLNRLHNWFC